MDLFTLDDFKVFDIQGFDERMTAIKTRIRPKLTSMGNALASRLGRLVDGALWVHVARHARRRVHAPDDTWVAFGSSTRGYKSDVHFKIAISRNCVRFLFEVGPEYYAKQEWVRAWHREFKDVSQALLKNKELGWFKSEHDENSALRLRDLSSKDLNNLADELTRRKDGQLVLGRRVDRQEFLQLQPKEVEQVAVGTFEPLSLLFRLQDSRFLALSRN